MSELPPSDVSGEEARELADQVLSGRAYFEASRPPSLRERVLDWIGDLIGDLFSSLSSTGGRGIFAWLVIAAFAALIVYFVSKLVKNLSPLPARQPDPELLIEVVGERSSADWLRLAAEAEAQSDWRSGVRCRHRSLVRELIARDLVSARPGQTAGEIQRMVSERRPEAASEMQAATWLFKDVWYGWVEAGPEHRDEFIALSERVLTQTGERPRELATA